MEAIKSIIIFLLGFSIPFAIVAFGYFDTNLENWDAIDRVFTGVFGFVLGIMALVIYKNDMLKL